MSSAVNSITESSFCGTRSYVMETEQLRAIIIPELGGSIVSLTYKPTGKEWLVDSPDKQLRRLAYGDAYSEEAMYGWDECFPTIISCGYPADGKFKGNQLPDHGELWSIPWIAEKEHNALRCEAKGIALPYTFARTLSFPIHDRLRFTYRVSNESNEPLRVLWTPHPLFAATEQTEIRLASDIGNVLCVDGGKRYETGKQYAWPQSLDKDGRGIHAFRKPSVKDSRKFYVDGPIRAGWAALMEQDTGECLSLEWDPLELPYLGIWINEGQYNNQLMCALEPSNGFYDDLEIADQANKVLEVGAGSAVSWSLDVWAGKIT